MKSLGYFVPLALALLLLVPFSGCIQPTSEQPTVTQAGIVITDFSASRDVVEGKNKPVRIYMEIENQGGYPVEEGKAIMCLIGSFGEVSTGMWQLESDQCQKTTRRLEAYDPVNNIPGGTTRATWSLKSPFIYYPDQRTDGFTGRVYYNYKTRTTAKIVVYSEAEIEAAKQRGETLSSIQEQIKSMSPVQIQVSVPNIIRVEDEIFSLEITVSNIGGGVVFNSTKIDWDAEITTPPELTIDDLNYIKLSLTVPSGLEKEFCEDIIELKKGETRTITCDFRITETITTKKSYPIIIEAEYGYYVDKELSITVRGKRGEKP